MFWNYSKLKTTQRNSLRKGLAITWELKLIAPPDAVKCWQINEILAIRTLFVVKIPTKSVEGCEQISGHI